MIRDPSVSLPGGFGGGGQSGVAHDALPAERGRHHRGERAVVPENGGAPHRRRPRHATAAAVAVHHGHRVAGQDVVLQLFGLFRGGTLRDHAKCNVN